LLAVTLNMFENVNTIVIFADLFLTIMKEFV
jgi:hypothetical protein